MTPITALGSRYGIQGALGRSVKRAASGITDPTDITGCLQWLDFSDANYMFTDAGTTKVSSDGDAIYQVNDKSGNSNHAVQSTLGNRPLYKTGVKNSKSVARFDGNQYWLDLTGLTSAASSYTLFSVFYNNESPDNSGKYLIDSQSGRLIFALHAAAGSSPYTYTGYYDGAWAAIFENTTTKWQIDTWKLESGVGGYVYQDGVLKGNGTYTAKAIGGTTRLGMPYNTSLSSPLIAMDLAEIVLYTSALSDTDRASVETYLNNKWNIY